MSSVDVCPLDPAPHPLNPGLSHPPLLGGSRFTTGSFAFALQKIEIFSPPGRLVGTVEQDWSILASPAFTVRNETDEPVLRIKGPRRTRGGDGGFKVKFV